MQVCVSVCLSLDQIICSQTAGALVNKYFICHVENDSIYKTQRNCLDKEEVESNQQGYDIM